MATPAKEAVAIILDVGSSMSYVRAGKSRLESARNAVNLLVQQKLLFGKNDEVGLVLVGTADTKNRLAASSGGYEHVTMLRDVSLPDLDLLRSIEAIEPSTRPDHDADLLDALIVALDMLIERTEGKKYSRRVFMVTDAAGPLNDADLDVVLKQFNRLETALNIIGVDFSPEDEDAALTAKKPRRKVDNEKMLAKICTQIKGRIYPVHDAIMIMSMLRSRSVLQRTCFRGSLEISPHVKIPVYSYMKTMEQKFPSMKKLSVVSQQSLNPETMNVAIERSYQSISDPDVEVPAEDRVKGYKYGKTLVPFSKIDEEVLKYTSESCLKVIGFTNARNVPRHHFMGNTEAIVLDPSCKPELEPALSALIEALHETDMVAIVRYVKRKNGNPHLGLLWPCIKPHYDCLYYNSLPTTEDLRQYPFAPLDVERVRKSCRPSSEQLRAAEELINALDLMHANVDPDDPEATSEMLKPKHIFNPALQRFYQTVQHRALHPSAPLPKLDPVIERYLNPDQNLFKRAAPALKKFKELFPVSKPDEGKEKADRVYWRDSIGAVAGALKLDSYAAAAADGADKKKKRKAAAAVADSAADSAAGAASDLSFESIVSSGVESVGALRPVDDAKQMLGRRDVDLVDKALEGLRDRATQLVNESVGDMFYAKALDCVVFLRQACIAEDEPQLFNEFIHHLRRTCRKDKRRDAFWQLLVNKRITLITTNESVDSEVTNEEAKQFLLGDQDFVVSSASKDQKQEAEDLLDMAE